MCNFKEVFRTILCLSFSLGAACTVQHTAPVNSITTEEILEDVRWLASDELQGRFYRSEEARRAAKYIATKWKDAGLVPIPSTNSMYLPTDDMRDSPNVAAMLKGSTDSYVFITAHYDHLKPRRRGEDRIYNGADDNASGTAALIAIGNALGRIEEPLDASIVLVAFTGEEAGLIGSKHFAEHSPIPLHRIQALINLDMISRGEPNTIFLEGTPDAPRIARAITKANQRVGLHIVRNQYPDWLYRSDQAPFLDRGVPSVMFSVEDHEDYHRVSDETDKIIPELAAKTTRLTFLTAYELARHVP